MIKNNKNFYFIGFSIFQFIFSVMYCKILKRFYFNYTFKGITKTIYL